MQDIKLTVTHNVSVTPEELEKAIRRLTYAERWNLVKSLVKSLSLAGLNELADITQEVATEREEKE